jgi:phosphoribosylanthranilate isomerase
MALNTFVKISNINNLSDARFCAGMGVDLLGFNIDQQTKDYIHPDKFNEIVEWISGVEFVGEFTTDNFQNISNTIGQYPVHYIQYCFPELANAILSLGLEAIYKTTLPAYSALPEFMKTLRYMNDKVNHIILDGIDDFNDPDTVKILHLVSKEIPVLISGNISVKNVLNLQKTFNIHGLSLPGGNEIKPGYRDLDELTDILEKIEVDD